MITTIYRGENSMNLQIRAYNETDLAAVLDAWEVATRLAHTFMSDDFIASERENVAHIYLPNTDTWVAVVEGEVVGFIALMDSEVGAIFVQPRWHGLRVGKALMDKAQSRHSNLEVEVFKENTIGRTFYANYGFKKIAQKWHEATAQQVLRLRYTA